MGHNTIQRTMLYAHLATGYTPAAVERLISSGAVVINSSTVRNDELNSKA